MADATKVTASYGVTINAGNYESVKYMESIEAVLNDDENAGEALTRIQSWLKKRVNAAGVKLAKDLRS